MALLVDIEKTLGTFQLKVQLQAEAGVTGILGASGCGKSVTLKCIAGLMKPDRGHIELDGVTLFDAAQKIDLSPQKRRTGLMLQQGALFPHMTVLENIMAGANREKQAKVRKSIALAMMERFGITELYGRYPHQLSGGQQQRVALARILVSGPNILLLDEPFTALDSHLKFRLEQEVRQVLKTFAKTVLFVSHDREEVYRMSQHIAVMEEGHIRHVGEREAVFGAPRTKSGAVLTGCKNVFRAAACAEHTLFLEELGVPLTIDRALTGVTAVGIPAGCIRPGPGPNGLLCRVRETIPSPGTMLVLLEPLGTEATLPLVWELPLAGWEQVRGETVGVHIPPENLLLLE